MSEPAKSEGASRAGVFVNDHGVEVSDADIPF